VTRSFSIVTERRVALALAFASLLATTACSDKVLQGKGSSYLVIELLEAASGPSGTYSTVLQSDVATKTGGAYEDYGQVTLRIAMKDVTVVTGVEPTANNLITVNRYHVDFVRSDGRNTQGVDVPYSVDGATTGTIGVGATSLTFTLVPLQRKLEAPLLALRNHGGAIAIMTIANVTFYGYDQAGNTVSVTGSISVNFADWADDSK
jgi:hypothetical protein